jgi:hypothetical protein
MKRLPRSVIVGLLAAALLACNFAEFSVDLGGLWGADAPHESVQAAITSPPNGASLAAGQVDIVYRAGSPYGVSAVELSINEQVVDVYAPPSQDMDEVALVYVWLVSSAGSHTIRVRAMDNSGAWGEYATTAVQVQGEAQTPPAPDQQAMPPMEPTPQVLNSPDISGPPSLSGDAHQGFAFLSIEHDKDTFFYGRSTCGSRELTITVRVNQPDKVYAVYLFTRFRIMDGQSATSWDAGRAMRRVSEDTFSARLISNEITNYNTYTNAMLNYQIVIQDRPGSVYARSDVIRDVNLRICQ